MTVLRASLPSSFRLLPIAETQPQRRAHKRIRLADAILQIAFVRHVHQLRIVDEEQERRRIGAHLRAVENLQAVARVRRR